MIDAEIPPGDVLLVDRSLNAKHDDIMVASMDGEFTVKTLVARPRIALVDCNNINRSPKS
tara:strand:- start:615 stop:794 length:180 start_codon:yes stop_codon:yes gene_type:complete